MKTHAEQVIGQIAARLFSLPLEEYLESENFLRFCRQHELEDAWQEALRRSRDRPDLYGKSVIKMAFELFLLYLVHNRQGEFPDLFSGFLTGFSQASCRPLPLDELKKDLAELGCDTDCPGM